MSFNDFIHKHTLKNKTTSNTKMQQILFSLSLRDVGTYLRDGPFRTDIGIVNLHPFQGTHWVLCIQEPYFDPYGITPPHKLSVFITKRIGQGFFSECKIQCLSSKKDSLLCT